MAPFFYRIVSLTLDTTYNGNFFFNFRKFEKIVTKIYILNSEFREAQFIKFCKHKVSLLLLSFDVFTFYCTSFDSKKLKFKKKMPLYIELDFSLGSNGSVKVRSKNK